MTEWEYDDLNAMLRSNGQAWEYYTSLPDYVRDHISSRGSNVKTLSSLQAYGENLLQGDR
jgi:hypothetical protein